MPKVETISVSLPLELATAVRMAVEDGTYTSSEEAISDAVVGWKQLRETTFQDTERLREMVRVAREDPRPSIPAEEVFARLRERFSSHAK